MKVTKTDLAQAVRAVQQTTKDDPKNPAFGVFRFTSRPEKGSARMASFDGVTSVTASLPAVIDEDEKFDVIVPSKQFVAAGKSCPKEKVKVTVEKGKVILRSGGFKTAIVTRNGLEVQNYVLDSPSTTLNCMYGELVSAIRTCSGVLLRGTENPQFANVHLIAAEKATFVAMSPFSAMEVVLSHEGASESVALPGEFCSLVAALGMDPYTEVELQVGNGGRKLALYVKDTLYVCSPVSVATVPPYGKFLASAEESNTLFDFDIKEFEAMLARSVGLAAVDRSQPYVNFQAHGGKGVLKCDSATGNTEEEFEYAGDIPAMSFDGAILLRALKVMSEDAALLLPPSSDGGQAIPLYVKDTDKKYLLQQVRKR